MFVAICVCLNVENNTEGTRVVKVEPCMVADCIRMMNVVEN